MKKFAKAVRIATLAPIMAFVLITLCFLLKPGSFDAVQYILAIIFLTVLPMLGYPLQPHVPHFKDKGREGQRNLAMVMAVIGYVIGIIVALATGTGGILLIIYLTYLFSGLLLMLFNKVFKIRASGHAGGVAGPLGLLILLFGPPALLGLIILGLMCWASLVLKRHTVSQLIIGSIIPLAALVIAVLICGGFSVITG